MIQSHIITASKESWSFTETVFYPTSKNNFQRNNVEETISEERSK